MKDCWVTSNKLRNGSAGWPLRPGKVAVLTAHQWPLPRALCMNVAEQVAQDAVAAATEIRQQVK